MLNIISSSVRTDGKFDVIIESTSLAALVGSEGRNLAVTTARKDFGVDTLTSMHPRAWYVDEAGEELPPGQVSGVHRAVYTFSR